MEKSTNRAWLMIHGYLSMFFLPVGILYCITGGLYIMGVHGGGKSQSVKITLAQPLPDETEALRATITQYLEENRMAIPDGQPRLFRGRLIWGKPTGYSVMMQVSPDKGETVIQANYPSLYAKLVLLHKAKGGVVFKILGVAFATAMLVMYISGLLLCLKTSKTRKTLLVTVAVGIVITGIAILGSV